MTNENTIYDTFIDDLDYYDPSTLYNYKVSIKFKGKLVSDIAVNGEYIITSENMMHDDPDLIRDVLKGCICYAGVVISFDDYTEETILITGVTMRGNTIYLRGVAYNTFPRSQI